MGDNRTYEDWVSAFETGTDYEADLVRDRLDAAGLPAVVLTQRDHAFNLNVGDLSAVHVMVPPERLEEARDLLEGESFSDEELDEAAMNADVDAEPAHSDREEAMLDSAPNVGGEEETIEEPGVHEHDREREEEAGDPRAKRKHRDERRRKVREEDEREEDERDEGRRDESGRDESDPPGDRA